LNGVAKERRKGRLGHLAWGASSLFLQGDSLLCLVGFYADDLFSSRMILEWFIRPSIVDGLTTGRAKAKTVANLTNQIVGILVLLFVVAFDYFAWSGLFGATHIGATIGFLLLVLISFGVTIVGIIIGVILLVFRG
jgi:hypothetical protein